jgi:hypothetical protein
VADHEGRLGLVESGVSNYLTWKTTVEKKFSDALDNLQVQLANTNSVIVDLRDNSFERRQNSGGRNILGRIARGFKGDKYLITNQSLNALKSIMIKSQPEYCPPLKNSASGEPAKPCPTSKNFASVESARERYCDGKLTKAVYSCDLEIDAIIRKLSSIASDPPQSESDFMKKLRTATRIDGNPLNQTTVDRWKSFVLKYARVAY